MTDYFALLGRMINRRILARDPLRTVEQQTLSQRCCRRETKLQRPYSSAALSAQFDGLAWPEGARAVKPLSRERARAGTPDIFWFGF